MIVKIFKHHAFTLIELLIVVAIIAILAAIAVPNFLEAQTRSKISRVKSDLRTLATGLEAYRTDNNTYPLNRSVAVGGTTVKTDLTALTTPLAYLSTLGWRDPFQPDKLANNQPHYTNSYLYANFRRTPAGVGSDFKNYVDIVIPVGSGYDLNVSDGFCVESWGPDRTQGNGEVFYILYQTNQKQAAFDKMYDPTNGTTSWGDIIRMGGSAGAGTPNP